MRADVPKDLLFFHELAGLHQAQFLTTVPKQICAHEPVGAAALTRQLY
jgi:hypothetical protein